MKKVVFAIAFVATGVTLVNAQTTDATAAAKTETVLENQVKAEPAVTAELTAPLQAADTVKSEEKVAVKKDDTALEQKQKAVREKKAEKK